MPAPQFHLTFGELVAHQDGIVRAVRDAVRREPVYTHLGSVFHDLPYYGNMIAEMIRYGFRRPAIDAPWAYRMHCLAPDRFVASYVRAARTAVGLTDDERLALIGGLVSHCALDLTLHPLVNYCARRDVALYGGHETFHHRVTEKYHALFFHLERFGKDPFGTPEFRKKTVIVKQPPRRGHTVESQIVSFMQEAFSGAFGNAPAPLKWSRWVRNFMQFGMLCSTPMVAANSKKSAANAELYRRYYRSDDYDLTAFYAHSERRVVELVNLAYDYFDNGDFSDETEAEFVRRARIDDLAEPDATDLPPLPALPSGVTPPTRKGPRLLRLPAPRRRRKESSVEAA